MSPHNQPTYYGSGRGRIFWGTISPLVRRGVRWNSLLKLFTAPAQIWGKKLTEKEVCQLNQGALHIAYCNWKWIQSSIGLGQGAIQVHWVESNLSLVAGWFWEMLFGGFETKYRLQDDKVNGNWGIWKQHIGALRHFLLDCHPNWWIHWIFTN